MAVYGSFPTVSLADASERVSRHLDESIELTNGLRATKNAFKLYAKTRPAASAESCVRAKKLLGMPACHPLFTQTATGAGMSSGKDGGKNGGKEGGKNGGENKGEGEDLAAVAALHEGAAVIAAALQGYRPAATVLEAEVAAPRRGLGAGVSVYSSCWWFACGGGVLVVCMWYGCLGICMCFMWRNEGVLTRGGGARTQWSVWYRVYTYGVYRVVLCTPSSFML